MNPAAMSASSPYATAYARFIDAGYSVIPILPGDKAPGAFKGGRWVNERDWQRFGDRLPTDFELRIWSGWADAGIGVCLGPASGNLVAIDLDYGSAEIRRAIESCLPPSPVRKVGAKGYTAFYRGDPNLASKVFRVYDKSAGRKVSVCEILARGRQTVLPPTIHPDTGRPYEWLTADTLDEMSVEDLPVLTLDLADRIAAAIEPFGYEPEPQYVPASAGYAAGQDETIWRSLNNTALANLGAWVPALGLHGLRGEHGRFEAVATWRPSNGGRALTQRKRNLKIASNGIRDFGDDRSYTPLDLVMAAGDVPLDSAFEWLHRRVIPEEATILLGKPELPPHDPETGEIIEEAAPSPSPAAMPTVSEISDAEASAPPTAIDALDPRTAGGLLSDISDWMLANAWRPCPEFAVLGAVAFMSAIAGRRFVTPNGIGLNVYLMGIAGPGVGKDPVIKYPPQLLYECQMANLIGPDDPSSDSAIEKSLRKCPAILMPIEEVGIFLQGVAHQRSGPWERKIRKLMLDLYSRSTYAWQGKTRAGEDDGGDPIQSPTMSIVGVSNPNDFYNGITEANLSDGMIARLTIVAAKTRSDRRRDRSALLSFPPGFVKRIQGFVEAFPQPAGNLASHDWRNPDPTRKPYLHAVPWASPDAEARWLKIEDWQLEVAERDPEMQGIVGRAAEQTSKFATMRAVSRNPSHPAVTVEDVEWGWSFVSGSIETVDAGVKAYLAGSEFERLHKVMFAAIKAAGAAGIARSDLMRKRGVSKAPPRDYDSAVAYLENASLIYPQDNSGARNGGRPGVRYFARPDDE